MGCYFFAGRDQPAGYLRLEGQSGFDVLLVTGPFSKFWLTFMSVILVWLLGGLALGSSAAGRSTPAMP
jgi:hypothetical protein